MKHLVVRCIRDRDWRRWVGTALGLVLLIAAVIYGWNALSDVPTPIHLVVYAFSTQEEVLTESIFPAFEQAWEAETGRELTIERVFGPSGTLAGQINGGAPADVVDSLHVVLRAASEPGLRERGIDIIRNLESTMPKLDLAAHFYASLGAMDEAITAVRNLVELHSYQVALLNWPEYRALCSDPRFLAIVDEVGLPRPPWAG